MDSEAIIKAVADIPTYILEDDIRLYQKYASQLLEGSLIVDVGTGLAKSAIALALSNPRAVVQTFETGEFPLQRGWAKDILEYNELITNRLDFHNITNVTRLMEDITLHSFPSRSVDLLHIDGEKDVEEEILEHMLPALKDGAIILVRNVDRFSNRGLNTLRVYGKKLEKRGKVIVYKKI